MLQGHIQERSGLSGFSSVLLDALALQCAETAFAEYFDPAALGVPLSKSALPAKAELVALYFHYHAVHPGNQQCDNLHQ